MLAIYIDTALFAVPNYAVDTQTADQIFDQLLIISNVILAHLPVRFVASPEAEESLWSANCGPSYDQIHDFINLMGLQEIYSANDVTRVYQMILQHACRDAHDETNPLPLIEAISNFRSGPLLPNGLIPTQLRAETEHAFATVAMMEQIERGWFLSSPIGVTTSSAYKINVQVDAIKLAFDAKLGPLPISVSEVVNMFESVHDWVDQDAGLTLWERSKSSLELAFAIAIGALTLRKGAGFRLDPSELIKFSIGPQFFESLDIHQCLRGQRFSSAAYSLCTQIVAELCSKRIGTFGKPNQTIRADGGRAWRTHLTGGKAGLRLMHWTNELTLEFANVGVKHELKIEHGHPGAKARVNLEGLFN